MVLKVSNIGIVATLPFNFESQCHEIAESALLKLKANFKNVIVLDHSAHINVEKPMQISLEDYFADVADRLAVKISV